MGKELLYNDDAWPPGQKVQITAGPFIGFKGVIYLIDRKERLARVMIDIHTKQTPVEVPISSLKAIDDDT